MKTLLHWQGVGWGGSGFWERECENCLPRTPRRHTGSHWEKCWVADGHVISMLDKALTRSLTPHSLGVKDCLDPLCISISVVKHPEGSDCRRQCPGKFPVCGGVSCGCDLTLGLGNHNRGCLEPHGLVVFSCPVEGGTARSNNLTST